MANADDLDVFFIPSKQLADGFRLGLYGTGRGLFDQQIAVLALLKSKEDQVNRLF